MFFPAKHKQLAAMISISSVESAGEGMAKIDNWIREAKTTKMTDKRLSLAVKSCVLAANRARAMIKKTNISPEKKKDLRDVANQWVAFSKNLSLQRADLRYYGKWEKGRGYVKLK
jgi:hypothetical protein